MRREERGRGPEWFPMWALSYERQGMGGLDASLSLSLSLCVDVARHASLTFLLLCLCGVVRKDAGQFGLRLENEGPEASRIQVHIKNSH